MMVQYCCGSGSTNNLFCKCFILWQEANGRFYMSSSVKTDWYCSLRTLAFAQFDVAGKPELVLRVGMPVSSLCMALIYDQRDLGLSLSLSRIDYCNLLLFGSTHDVTSHLQLIQNYAARVILRLPMSSRITIHLKSLHWLPVKVRSTYKIACLCYHCHSSTAPSYITDMLHKKPLHTRNTRSSSYTMPLLNRPAHSKATLGDRSFSFASSSVWNSIPNDVRCAPSLSSFNSRLKTYLFRSVYKD